MNLAERYAEACATPSDIYLHLPRFVELVERLDARHVIELGSRSGVSTVAWLYALERNGGRLTSVDLDEAPQIGTWGHWEHIRGDDCDPEVVARLAPAEIVFIDTSHHYGHTVRELDIYRALVKPGGVLVLHDTELAMPFESPLRDGVFPVKRAVREFCRANDLPVAWVRECFGLAVIQL